MKPSAKNTKTLLTKVLSKREEKKRINIRSGSGLRFQIGLIASLLLALIISESGIGSYAVPDIVKKGTEIDEVYSIGKIIIESPPEARKTIAAAKKPVVRKPITPVFNPDKVNTNESADPEPSGKYTEGEEPDTSNPEPDPGTTIPSEPTGPENINSVEFVPVFPGCEGLATNHEKVACMSSKIKKFISRNFNTDVAEGESGERQRITVLFKINTQGEVTDVKARAPDRSLEREAARVINKLPQMAPGRQGNKKVDVLYMVPIVFQVE